MTRIVDLMGGNIAVIAPFSETIVVEVQIRHGKWQDVAIKQSDGSVQTQQAWVLSASHREAMQGLLSDLLPPRSTIV